MDLDDFKQVNDSLGHAAGGLLLKGVAERLRHCVRDTDTVARMGGDEVVVLLGSIKLPEHAALVSENVRNALSEPVVVYGRSLCILPSVGAAIYPEDGDEEGQLLRHADEAMYAAKAGRNIAPGKAMPARLAYLARVGARDGAIGHGEQFAVPKSAPRFPFHHADVPVGFQKAPFHH